MVLILLAGATSFGLGLAAGGPENWPRFLAYLGGSAVASVLKVYLPGVTGTMSVNFLLVLMAIATLTSGEAVMVAAAGVAVQYAWSAKCRLRIDQLTFNVSAISTAAFVAWHVHHSSFLRGMGVEELPVLCLSATVYFVLNTLPVAVVIALTEKKRIPATWRECYLWSFPYYAAGAAIVGLMEFLGGALGWQTAVLILPFVYFIYRSYQFYLGRLESEKKHAEEMAALHLRTIEALALAIEAKDHTTNDHLHRVQIYAQALGAELGLSRDELDALQAASLLHDIGKLAVPEHIISKPGKLTPEEFEKMKIHPVVGAEILERVQFPYPVVPIVLSHHEKWDGTGYPNGMSGEDIPIGARILAAVDCLDALATDRQYRRALPLDQAMQVVREQAGKSFDPRIVELLERRYIELEAVARRASSDKKHLSRDIKIAPGVAPAAGYQETSASPAVQQGTPKGADFLASIAAARSEVQALFELSQSLGSSLSLVETLSVLAQRLQSVVPHSSFAIWLIRHSELQPEYVAGQDADLFRSLKIPVGQGLSGWVAETGKYIVNGNPSVEPGYMHDSSKFSTLRSAIAVPLEGVGARLGVLTLCHRDAQAFTQDHLRILLAITSKLGLAIENSLRFRAAESGASTDHLTGLPNARSLFVHLEQEIARRKRDDQPLTVLVCDVDGFKNVNDSFGHLEGNRILARVGGALKAHCRESDYVARMSGDEFVIVLNGINHHWAESTAERMRKAVLDTAVEEYGRPLYTLTVGAAEWQPGQHAEELLGDAERQMCLVKRRQKRNDQNAILELPALNRRAV
jgi:diguanylate cyclase (GGDEF)-like protein/putative nucleotidyltransferase with HDIG domain